jgi:putative transcriptional regulator
MYNGMKVRIKRIENGFKQYEFAEMVGVSREYLRLIEKSRAKNPSIEVMKKISDLLQVSVVELFFNN